MAWLLVVVGTIGLRAGIYTRTSFHLSYDGVRDSNITAVGSGVGLAVERKALVKITNDNTPPTTSRTICPEVISPGVDTFSFFYVDTAMHRVMRWDARLQSNSGASFLTPVSNFNVLTPANCYLHVDQGHNGLLASYIQRAESGNKRFMQVNNGTNKLNIDSAASTGWLFASQCGFEHDTFFTINSVDMEIVTLRKIYSNGATITVLGSATVATGSATPGNALANCAVASDSQGNVCTAFIRGSPNGLKYLAYRFFDSDLAPGPSGSYADPVSDTVFHYYDDVSIISCGPESFLLVSWGDAGVVLHKLTRTGGSVNETHTNIINKPGVRFCRMASNRNYLVIVAAGDIDGNGRTCIEGIRYQLSGCTITNPESFSFSDPLTEVDTRDLFSTAVNCAMDDSGSVAVTWRHGERIMGCIWANRSIRYRKGFYTSPVESLSTVGDSVWFSPAQIAISSTASWFTEDSLRFGSDSNSCSLAPWVSLSDPAVLAINRTRDRYFQFRIAVNRASSGIADSIGTPTISAVTIPWNAQPRITGIDSLIIANRTEREVLSGRTLELTARLDTVHLFLSGYDMDEEETVTFSVSMTATPQSRSLNTGPNYHSFHKIHPFSVSDTVYQCVFSLSDASEWNAVRKSLNFRTKNIVPHLSARLVHVYDGGFSDTVFRMSDTVVVLQEEESVVVDYEVSDSNDAEAVRGYVIFRGADDALSRLDSAYTGTPATYTLLADTSTPVDTVRLWVCAVDPDTTTGVKLNLLINHRPHIEYVLFNGDTVHSADTVNVTLGIEALFSIAVRDTDCAFNDTLTLRSHLVAQKDSFVTTSTVGSLRVTPAEDDTVVFFSVTDRFGRSDTIRINLAYPWYETDSLLNPGYNIGKKRLVAGPSLIDGHPYVDTIIIPVRNSGRNSFSITGCEFSGTSESWFKVIIDRQHSPFIVSSQSSGFSAPVKVDPDSTLEIAFLFSAEGLFGDGVLRDTLTLFTDDPSHRRDRFPVQLEYNDLPRLISIVPDFVADRPYRAVPRRAAYVFPPHAAISISFSEPVDSLSAFNAVRIYSVNDSRITHSRTYIGLRHEWLQGYTVLHLTPYYESASPAFGLKPPQGLFIPTDSVVMTISSGLHDCAQTPSGPNPLDIDRDLRRDVDTDTSIGMRVDSIDFTVLSIDPSPGSVDVGRDVSITLKFSSAVYAASIDTSLGSNRSLIVTSRYNGGRRLAFKSVAIDSFSVVFTLAQTLFYLDTLRCRYASRWIRDRLGYASDNNRDGIDATIFDTASCDDDIEWGYRIRPVSVASVEPDSGEHLSDVSPTVTIRFDGTLPTGSIDTDTSVNNRSLRIGSMRTGWSSFLSIEILPDSTGIVLVPKTVFFSNDSVYCQFTGFSSQYSYGSESNLPDSGAAFGSYSWSFLSGELGFYTFPNPYKPGSDRRHCADNGPCGIWFKNLHTLGTDIDEVHITVFSMAAHPLFDTRRRGGGPIRFGRHGEGALPQWLWDTRNNHGELVASGLYLYTIYSVEGRILRTGKLIIAR